MPFLTYAPRIRRCVLLGLPMLLALTACGHTSRDYKEVYEITVGQQFSARDKPADVTELAAEDLAQKDYLMIGTIDVVQEAKMPELDGIMSDLKRKAAGKGADLIRATISSPTGREATTTCDEVFFYTDRSSGYRTQKTECRSRSTETKLVALISIKGTLWRHDPQEKARREAAVRAIKEASTRLAAATLNPAQLAAYLKSEEGRKTTPEQLDTLLEEQASTLTGESVTLILNADARKGYPPRPKHHYSNAFLNGIKAGNVQMVTALIKGGYEVAYNPTRPPHCRYDGPRDFDPDCVTTPIEAAALSGSVEMIDLLEKNKMLFQCGPDYNYCLDRPEAIAALLNHQKAFDRLLQLSTRNRSEVMMDAVRTFSNLLDSRIASGLHMFLSAGLNINYQTQYKGMTALMFASANGNLLMVRELLKQGAGHRVRDKDGKSALDWAKKTAMITIAEELTRHGAQ